MFALLASRLCQLQAVDKEWNPGLFFEDSNKVSNGHAHVGLSELFVWQTDRRECCSQQWIKQAWNVNFKNIIIGFFLQYFT